MVYTAFYGLRARPFPLAPDPAAHFESESHRRAVACLSHALERGPGIVVITGEPGTGKTTLVGWLETRLGPRRVIAPRLPAVTRGPADLLAAIGTALGLGAVPDDQAVAIRAIEAGLRARAPDRGSLLLAIDEAQGPPAPVLDVLRPVADLGEPDAPLLRILLLGRPELRERLAAPSLAGLRERVVAGHRLGPLEPEEVRPYVEHRLARVGWRADPRLGDDVYAAIRLATAGVPRAINRLCTRLLVLGALDQRHELGAAEVEEAASDLREERLPASPAEAAAAARAVASVAPAPGAELWRRELARLRRRVDSLHDELARERRRRDAAEAEAARLRVELHRLELARLGIEPAAMRRLLELAGTGGRPAIGPPHD